LLLVISNSGHYIWYIYLNIDVSQTDDCELGLMFITGSFFIDYCHVLTAKYSNYLLSCSGFFWHILLYKYATQYVSWNNNYVFFDTTIVQFWVW